MKLVSLQGVAGTGKTLMAKALAGEISAALEKQGKNVNSLAHGFRYC
jgi:ATP-dependent 26S proteasome regulatory subunit